MSQATEQEALRAAEKATALAECYGEAILAISAVLDADLISDGARVNRIRAIIAGLDSEGQA